MVYMIIGRVSSGKSFLLEHMPDFKTEDYTNRDITDYTSVKADIETRGLDTIVIKPSQINRIAEACPDTIFHLVGIVADPDDRKLNSEREEDDFIKTDDIDKDLYDKLEKCYGEQNYTELEKNITIVHVFYNTFGDDFLDSTKTLRDYKNYMNTMCDITKLALQNDILGKNPNKTDKTHIVTMYENDKNEPVYKTIEQFADILSRDTEGFTAVITQLIYASDEIKEAIHNLAPIF